ncbi:MAG: hypothetical protein PHN37_03130, partial [Candidatus Pacebacteria bacterium]|nr:hypothetical protein [Candidatus Paceibacterota bacterium]
MVLPFQFSWPLLLFFWVFWLIIFPGYLVLYLVFKEKFNFYERIGMSFAFGFIVFSLFGVLGYFFSLPLNFILLSISIVNILLLLFLIIKRQLFQSFFPYLRNIKKRKDFLKIGIVLILFSLIFSLISFGAGWFPRGDTAIHLQAIRKIVSQKNINKPIYSLNTKPPLWDHAYDTYYLLIATITKYSSLDLTVVWHYLSGIFSLLLPFVVFVFLKNLKASNLLIFNSLLFLLLIEFFIGIRSGPVLNTFVSPNRAYLFLIFPVAILFFLKYLSERELLYGIASSTIAVFQILIHQNGFLFYYWLVGGFLILFLLLYKYHKDIFKKIIFILALTTIFALPLLLLKLSYNQSLHQLATEYRPWESYYHFWHLTKGFYAFNFSSFLNFKDLMTSIIVIFIGYRIFKSRKKNKFEFLEGFLFISFLVPIFIKYNPFLMPFFSRLTSYSSVGRMTRLQMDFLIFAYGFTMVIKYLTSRLRVYLPRLKNNFLLYGASYFFLIFFF